MFGFRNKNKNRITLIIALAVTVVTAFPSYAGQWELTDDGYKYKKDDGTYCISEWLLDDDGFWYHFGDDEIMQTGWINLVTQSEEESDSSAETADAGNAGTAGTESGAEGGESEENAGHWYFLETATDSSVPYGSCYIDTITPDGLVVDKDGEWDNVEEEASPSEIIGRMAAGWALSQVGATYSQERRMDNGYFDCSSLVYRAYRSLGIDISANGDSTAAGIARKMMLERKMVKKTELAPGDLIFYKNEKGEELDRYKDIGHVSIVLYTDGAYGYVVSASETAGKVVVDDFGPYGQCIYARPSKEVSEEKYMERKGDFDRLRQHKGILPGHQLFD